MAETEARKYWECIYCGTRNYEPVIELAKVMCACGRGKGRWGVRQEQTLSAAGVDGGEDGKD